MIRGQLFAAECKADVNVRLGLGTGDCSSHGGIHKVVLRELRLTCLLRVKNRRTLGAKQSVMTRDYTKLVNSVKIFQAIQKSVDKQAAYSPSRRERARVRARSVEKKRKKVWGSRCVC